MDNNKAQNNVVSVTKVFTILELLSEAKEISLAELSKKLFMSKSTAFRFLQTMKDLGYVNQDKHTEMYTLSTKLYGLSTKALGTAYITKIANRYIHYLSKDLKETVHIAILDEEAKKIIYIYKENYNYALTMMSQVGKKAPLHCTGLGKLLLAYCGKESVDHILRDYDYELFTPKTIKNREEMERELLKIRSCGFSEDTNEHEENVHCIAVPIFDQFSNVVAAMSISWSQFRFDHINKDEAIEKIKACALQISHDLGYCGE
jgi:IclR family KDG regulon transcriptional repressor